MHQAADVSLADRSESERLEPCVDLRRSNLRDDVMSIGFLRSSGRYSVAAMWPEVGIDDGAV